MLAQTSKSLSVRPRARPGSATLVVSAMKLTGTCSEEGDGGEGSMPGRGVGDEGTLRRASRRHESA